MTEGDASMTVESHVWRGGRSLSAADRLSSADSLSSADNLSAADSPSAADHLSRTMVRTWELSHMATPLRARTSPRWPRGRAGARASEPMARARRPRHRAGSVWGKPSPCLDHLASLEIDEDNRSEATLRRHYSGSTQLADEDQRGLASPESPGERQAWIDERRAIQPVSPGIHTVTPNP